MQTATIIPTPDSRSASVPLPLRLAAMVAMIVALGLFAAVVAYWGWQLFGPRVLRVPSSAPADPALALVASGLFGASAAPPSTAVPEASSQMGDVRLLGVFAEPQGRGYALFRLSSGPKLVAAGKEIAPGLVLSAVRPDGIDVHEAAGDRRIALRAPATRLAANATGGVANPKAASPRSACAPPIDFKGQVVALNVELVGGLIAQPDGLRALVESVNGALVVRDDSGFAAMLGLKRGDRITQANGIALGSPDDVVSAVLRPLAAKQTVRLTGSRDGQTRELWLQNASC